MKKKQKRTRLSMKLLWKQYFEFQAEPIKQNIPQFLNFLEIRIKHPAHTRAPHKEK